MAVILCSHYGAGEYVGAGSEAHLAMWRHDYVFDGTKRPVLCCHGANGNYISNFVINPEIYAMVRDGLFIISADLGGINTWGNDTSMTRLGQLWTYTKARFNVKQDKMLLYGASMGGQTALRYSWNNPNNVAAIGAMYPVIDPDDIHDNDRSSLASLVESGYGGLSGWNTAEPTVNPNTSANRATFSATKIPTRIYVGSADTVCLPTIATAYRAAVPHVQYVDMSGLTHTGNPFLQSGVITSGVLQSDLTSFLKSYAS